MFKKLFIPSEDSDLTSLMLLVLRLWFGLTMLFNHGIGKLTHFSEVVQTFPDPLGLGQEASLVLVVMAEVLGSLMLVFGLMTRLAALVLVIDLFVAFLMVHKTALTGQGNGELSFIYLAGYCGLLIAGGGFFSMDTVVFRSGKRNQLPE